jgi:hypothetical protein
LVKKKLSCYKLFKITRIKMTVKYTRQVIAGLFVDHENTFLQLK